MRSGGLKRLFERDAMVLASRRAEAKPYPIMQHIEELPLAGSRSELQPFKNKPTLI